jgi:hypothetical protein
MDKKQVITLMKVINNCYQNFDVTEEKVNTWAAIMADVPFEKAQKNLMTHIKSNSFVPTPADIIKHDPNMYVDYEQQKIETRERLDRLRLMESIPQITPEELAEIDRKVRAGEYDEMFKDDPYLGKKVPIGD